MADKVQFTLEDVLSDALYLVKKGVFSQGELQQQMKRRERFEHDLVKTTHRTTDHLKAIEYEYELQRIRRYRQENSEQFKLDPKFKKANTKDFSIVKRIIRLWDRTMHRYRYRVDLWKEYLAFCYTVRSRKTFYKALSNALKFNPFDLQLWLSGVYYEIEANNNPWKARKVFHKALKSNKTNRKYWVEYLRFELLFAQIVLQRQQHITKGENVAIIGEGNEEIMVEEENVQKNNQIDEQGDGPDFQQDQKEQKDGQGVSSTNFLNLINTVIQESLTALVTEDDKQALARGMIAVLKDESWSQLLTQTINSALQHLQQIIIQEKIVAMNDEEQYQNLLQINYRKQYKKLKAALQTTNGLKNKFSKVQYFKPEDRMKLLRSLSPKELDSSQKLAYYLSWAQLMKETSTIDDQIFTDLIKQFGFKGPQLKSVIDIIIDVDSLLVYRKLINSKVTLPTSAATYYLLHSQELKMPKMDIDQILKRLDQKAYMDKEFLSALATYNKQNNSLKANLALIQKINRSYPQEKQLLSILMNIVNS